MKFIVSSSTLLKNIQILNSVIHSKNTIAILNNFLFDIQENNLIITASDLETTIITSIVIESDSISSIAVPASLLTETLKTFADQPLTFRIFEEESRLEIVSNEGNYSFSYFNGEDFPKIIPIENPLKVTIKGVIVSKAIQYTMIAMGKDETKQVLMGIFFDFSDKGAVFSATDIYRFIQYNHKDCNIRDNFHFIVPKKPLAILKTALSEINEDIQILYNDKNVEFSFQKTKIICRLIEGEFPDINSVLNENNDKFLIINRTQLFNSVRRINIFSNKTDYKMVFKVSGNELNISTEDVDFSNKGRERLTCNYQGDDVQIALNSKSLMEILGNLHSDHILITMNSEEQPCLIYPSDSLEEGESLVAIVRPMKL